MKAPVLPLSLPVAACKGPSISPETLLLPLRVADSASALISCSSGPLQVGAEEGDGVDDGRACGIHGSSKPSGNPAVADEFATVGGVDDGACATGVAAGEGEDDVGDAGGGADATSRCSASMSPIQRNDSATRNNDTCCALSTANGASTEVDDGWSDPAGARATMRATARHTAW